MKTYFARFVRGRDSKPYTAKTTARLNCVFRLRNEIFATMCSKPSASGNMSSISCSGCFSKIVDVKQNSLAHPSCISERKYGEKNNRGLYHCCRYFYDESEITSGDTDKTVMMEVSSCKAL